eukprot:gene24689-26566_t
MTVAPAGTTTPNTGHHHLIIDDYLPQLTEKIPSDFNHLHFGAGQTEAEITLPAGDHTLQLLIGDGNHVPLDPAVFSSELHIHVVAPEQAPAPVTATQPPAAPVATPQPAPAHVHSAEPTPAATPAPVVAQRPDRTPAPADARVYFVSPRDGAIIRPHSVIRFGLHNMGVAPAGIEKANTGHHHLLIDTDMPPTDMPLPNDFNHLHFGKGQTEVAVNLTPGRHTLQLVFADDRHIPHSPPIVSERITVTVATRAPKPVKRRLFRYERHYIDE